MKDYEELEDQTLNENLVELEVSDEDSILDGVEKEDFKNITAGSDPLL